MNSIVNKLKKLYAKRTELKHECVWLARQAKPCTGRLLLLFAIQLVTSVISVLMTLLNKRVIDRAIQTHGGFDAAAFVLIVVLTLLNIGVGVGGSLFSSMVSVRYTFDQRAKLYDRMLHSKWAALKRYHSGDIQSRVMGDLQTVADGILELVPECLGLTVRLVLAFIVLFGYDHMLALAALLLGPVGVLCSLAFAGRMKHYHVKLRENDAQVRCFVQESTENMVVMKTFSMEEDLLARYNGLRKERVELTWKKDLFTMAGRLSMNLVFTVGHLLAFGWGILRVSRAEITYGTMSVFLSLIGQIQAPIMGMSNVVSRFIGVLAAAGRVMELEDLEAEEPRRETALTGHIGARLDAVSFAYADLQDEQDAVLENVSLDIHPGESVALVGATGSGKTTIARLLLHLIDPTSGQAVFYDESGREEKASPSTRALIAYVPQGNTLSSGTIRENLLAGGTASEEKMREALTVAEADFALELGLDARIGERGIGLSEGQAQRLAIARALLREAPFLILDEASASLDMETERRIMENLRRAKTGKTCLVITHRPSLLALCDRCYRVMDGIVQEQKEIC